MSRAAISEFVTELVMHFPVRHESAEREREWLGTIAAAMSTYDARILKRAAQRIIDTRTDRRFPLVAELRKVAAQVVAEDKAAQATIRGVAPDSKAPEFSAERVRWADHLINGEMGKRAARDGWVLSLHDFCRKHGRLPQHHEVDKLKAAAKFFDEQYAIAVRGAAGPNSKALARLGDKMLARRNSLIDRVLHGVTK